jgi:hypothetical protein
MSRRERRSKARRRARLAAGAGLSVGVAMGAAGSAQAADFTVSNNSDTGVSGDGSLRGELIAANNNTGQDRILFAAGLSGSTITLTGNQLEIYDGVEIVGLGADKLTVNADHNDRVFYIDTRYSENYDVTISGLTITGGSRFNANDPGADGAGAGGGIFDKYSHLTVADSVITGNAAQFGGGIFEFGGYNDGEDTRILNSTISDNFAYLGGGISSPKYGDDERTQSFISGRSLGLIENSTIAENHAVGYGGGIYADVAGATIKSSTIAGNTLYANYDGGAGIYHSDNPQGEYPSGPFVIDNSIVANNTDDPGDVRTAGTRAAGDPPDDLVGGFDAAFTLVGDPTNSTINETVAGSNILNSNPLLGALQLNGGTTPTMAPGDGSPVLDKGKTPAGETIDQRHLTRPVDLPGIASSAAAGADGADMGAVERQGAAVSAASCLNFQAKAVNFDPRRPKAPFDLGVRSHFTVSTPSAISIDASLGWRKKGKGHKVHLGVFKVTAKTFKKVRIPLPKTLLGALEHGDRVKLNMDITVTPLNACAPPLRFQKKLRTRIINVQRSLELHPE